MAQRIVLSIDRSFLMQVDLVNLIEQKTPSRFGKPSGNGTKRTVKGPCPWCGGEDRFAVFVNETPQRYYCGIHGNGCHKAGDAIQFLRDWEDRAFREAVAILKGEDTPQVEYSSVARPALEDWHSERWQKRAAEFCAAAEKRLWEDETAGIDVLTYLVGRGFTEETIKQAHLGMALYQGSSIARGEKAPAPCLVIPWYSVKQLHYWRVELRDIRPGIDSKRRYESLAGSSVSDGLYGAESFNCPVFLVEGAIDALSIAQEAGDLVAVVATGSTGGSHNPKWLMSLAQSPRVFVAFDAEERAEQSAHYWLGALASATRWRTPIGKDANEMLQRDHSIRNWVQAALATLADEQEVALTAPSVEPAALPCCEICGALMDGYADEKWLCAQHYDELTAVEEKRDVWERIRAARAYVGIPRWLIPSDPEWNAHIAYLSEPGEYGGRPLYTRAEAIQEMLARRRAWFDQQETSQDVVLAGERGLPTLPIVHIDDGGYCTTKQGVQA